MNRTKQNDPPIVSFPKTLSSVTTKEFGTENATSPTCKKPKIHHQHHNRSLTHPEKLKNYTFLETHFTINSSESNSCKQTNKPQEKKNQPIQNQQHYHLKILTCHDIMNRRVPMHRPLLKNHLARRQPLAVHPRLQISNPTFSIPD